MIKVNWKHLFIGVILGIMMALFIRGELNEGNAADVQGQEAGADL